MMNKFKLRGNLIRVNELDGLTLLTIRTKRDNYNPSKERSNYFDYHTISIKEIPETIKIGMDIEVEGYISKNVKTLKDGTFVSRQRLYATKCEEARKELFKDFGVNAGRYVRNKNKFLLSGIISKIDFKGNNVTLLNLRTFVDEHENNVSTVIYGNNERYKDLKVGDKIDVCGNIQSSTQESIVTFTNENGEVTETKEKKYYINFVVTSLEKSIN